MSNRHREFVLPYAEPGKTSNPPVSNPSVYPNAALRSPYPMQKSTTPLATAYLPLLKKLVTSAVSLKALFEPHVGGGPPPNIMQLHQWRKFKKEGTSVCQDDGREILVRRPKFRSDLVGGEASVESFWTLMSNIIDLGIEHVSHQILTGTPFSLEGETEVFLYKIISNPRFRIFFTAYSNNPVMDFLARSVRELLTPPNTDPTAFWTYQEGSIFLNCKSAYVASQMFCFFTLFMTDFSLHVNRVVVQTTLRDETCGITPPAGLRFSDTTLPVEKMRFALSVIERIRRPSPVPEEVSEEVSEEDLAREIVFLQSESLFNATKAIVRKLTLAPIAYMLRKEGEEYHIPYEIFAFGAMLIFRELCILAHLPENFDMRLSDPESVGTYTKEDLLDWTYHTRLIEAAARTLPDTSAESPALAVLKELRDRLEDLCQLERVASDLWS